LKYERIINEGLTERLDDLLTALKSHEGADPANADNVIFQSLTEIALKRSAGGEDRPPAPPEGVHEHIKEKPSFPQMMVSLVDEVKKEIEAEGTPENRLQAFVSGIQRHKERVEDLTRQLLEKLAELEKEEKKHITSDDLHEGFSYSSVRKDPPASSSKAASSSKPTESVELLNPKRPEPGRTETGQSSGADGDIEEGSSALGGEVDDDSVEASPLAKQFARIKQTDFSALLQFIIQHPSILTEKEQDGLLVEAFNTELDGKHKHAKACVHAALLLQYCRQLGGPQGVQLFFKRITTKDHQAQKMFYDDVESTYRRIHTRAAEILKERAEKPQSGEGVEQIQLHAVDPNTTINIMVPPKVSEAEDAEVRAAEEASRAIFESFPPGLQRALESGKLDEVNKVLAKMSVEEAEEIVEKLGNGGMLSLENEIIDATTEEGKKQVEEIEKTHKLPKDSA
jgi:cell division cycle protein 37